MIFVMANVREMDGAEKRREGDRFFDLKVLDFKLES